MRPHAWSTKVEVVVFAVVALSWLGLALIRWRASREARGRVMVDTKPRPFLTTVAYNPIAQTLSVLTRSTTWPSS